MANEIDINKIVAELVSNKIDSIINVASQTVSKITTQFKGNISSTYSRYISLIYDKHSSYKTIIYRDTPHLLKDFYEPLDLINDKINLKSPGIIKVSELNKPILITGTGGCGKSTVMKALLLDTIYTKKYIPIFIELRYLEDGKISLFDFIAKSMKLDKLNLPETFIKSALCKGGYVIFFDGLDELSETASKHISEEIQRLAYLSSDNLCIVSSRPGKNFIAWADFIELKVAPLDLEKACALTNRLQIDENLKERFTEDMKAGLFEKHSTFFQNPLLLCMMILTYRDSASIPGDLHNFYSLAFDALYFRHDALKDGFRRPTKTQLAIDKGKMLMSAFSIVTYLKGKTAFSNTELHNYLKDAMTLTSINVNIRDLIDDLISAFCMLLKDGTTYTFTHRSFQEYFVALYLINAREEQQKKIIDKVISRASHDRTLDLAHGMNPDLIETLVVIPFLEEIKCETKYRGKINKTNSICFIKLFYDNISLFSHEKEIPDLMFGFNASKKSYQWMNSRDFVIRRFQLKKKISCDCFSTPKFKNANDFLIAYLQKQDEKGISISKIQGNKELSDNFLESCIYFKYQFQEMMQLLDELKKQHQDQVLSFENIFKK